MGFLLINMIIRKEYPTLRAGEEYGQASSPTWKLTDIGFECATLGCHEYLCSLTETMAKYLINLCNSVSTNNKLCVFLLTKMRRHSPLMFATGNTGWRSKTSWRPLLGHLLGATESLASMMVVSRWEHGGCWQRGRLWQGAVAGWADGGYQP